MSEEEDYFLDNYGHCVREADCYHERDQLGPGCLRHGWIGRACPHWRSLGAKSLEELRLTFS